jgi:H+/Cl- antiporter ClcA
MKPGNPDDGRSRLMNVLVATMRRLALLDATFYPTGVFSPTLMIGAFSGPIFRRSDAACRACDPNPRSTPAIAFFVATPPSLAPDWR